MIHVGDCLLVMAGMDAESVDAVVTDPPYGLTNRVFDEVRCSGCGWVPGGSFGKGSPGEPCTRCGAELTRTRAYRGGGFMGKQWDGTGIAFKPEAWAEMYRVAKPGAYLLAFGGTRTVHRMTCAIEDSGWIIRDMLMWIYASGFPKGRANLKPAHEPIVLARKPGPLRPLGIDGCRIPSAGWTRAGSPLGGRSGGIMGSPVPDQDSESDPRGRWPSNLLVTDAELFDEPNPWVVGSGAVTASGDAHVLRRGASTGAGMGYGSSAAGDVLDATYGDSGGYSRFFTIPRGTDHGNLGLSTGAADDDRGMANQGGLLEGTGFADREPVPDDRGLPDSGVDYPSAFLIPKSSRSDREPIITPDGHDRSKRFSTHPTQKPTDLMRHLIRLVTPPRTSEGEPGLVLDPFLGSGTTAIACELEGFRWIGIEKEPEYVAIAEARLNGTQRGLGLDVAAPTRKQPRPDPRDPSKHDRWGSVSFWGKPDEEPAA